MRMFPPLPVSPLPTFIDTPPPAPPTAVPVDMARDPDDPAAVVPVLNETSPLTPDELPEFELDMCKPPLDVLDEPESCPLFR